MADTIYVSLLGEGIDVWRPVKAQRLDGRTWYIEPGQDYDPSTERWEFTPGSTVICERRSTSQGDILAAVRLKKQSRRTA